ncbi:hypothetical protein AX15_007450, partial [Amanita polypyramis BW_CC]
MRLTHRLAYINNLFLDDLDMIAKERAKHVFKAWAFLFWKNNFYASSYDGPASCTQSKVRIGSHPPTPSPMVSQEGLPQAPRERKQQLKDEDYFDQLNATIIPPSQDDIEEQQNFLTNIYKIIEQKLEEENGIFLASDAEVSENKWSPLAPDADIPLADIIDQDWANMHSHTEFLWEQARLNNLAAANWRVWWSANPPDKIKYPDIYKQWNKLDDYCHQTTQMWYNIRFKELKEATALALDLDPITFKAIRTSTE